MCEPGGFGFGAGKFSFGAGDIQVAADAAIETAAHQPNLFFAQIHRPHNRGDLRIERPQCEIILRDFGMEREQDILKHGKRGLCVGAGAFEPAPDASPQINFVAQVERGAERIRRAAAEARLLVWRKTLPDPVRIGVETGKQFAARDPGNGSRLVDPGDGRF